MEAGKTRTVIAAGAIGNVLEWYDFAIYGYFATAIGRTFFPREDPVAQVLSAFGIFAVGFLMRPVGGALVGYIGDKLGRRAALTFSVTAMAIPTFLVGVLPGHDVLGVLAPIAPAAITVRVLPACMPSPPSPNIDLSRRQLVRMREPCFGGREPSRSVSYHPWWFAAPRDLRPDFDLKPRGPRPLR